ncbi:MAG: ATP-binding protein [Treponema sp.]|jgi:predicted AAA+ superfamily ATPase|nr:ATP-binding protein [Treponema sp.]
MAVSMEDLIREWQERPLPELTARDLDVNLKGSLAVSIIGMRRSGKTWRLFQEMENLAKEGVQKERILYFNFDDSRLASCDAAGPQLLDELLESYFRLYPKFRREGAYFFFDEIQEIPGWAKFARRLIDTEKVKLFLSGSSAKLLSTEVATEFRGRSLAFELLPFSFRETLRYHGISPKASPLDRSVYEKAFGDYLVTGGFPEALMQDDPAIRTGLLQSYLDSVVLRDVLERYGLSNARGVKELAHTLLRSNGNLVSVKRLSDQLAGRRIAMSRETVSRICAHLEDAFLVFFVPLYAYSLQKIRVNPQKVYAVDPGLALSVSPPENLGYRLEQAVYLELRRRYPLFRHISYYLTEDRGEVDFVLGDPARQLPRELIQVCASLRQKETRERELGALIDAMNELKLKQGTIITLYEQEEIKLAAADRTKRGSSAGRIRVVPAWKWFLEQPLRTRKSVTG